jgi:hypothetical protein
MNHDDIPEGWKLVPIEPTKEMLDAAWDDTDVAADADEFAAVYRAMLAAVRALSGG